MDWRQEERGMTQLKDQLQRSLTFQHTPRRIVSLVPSMTELVDYLGHGSSLVGCTKFCVHPAHLRKEISIIGGTKNVHIEIVKQLKPDLILANKEENVKEQVEALMEICQVYISNVKTLDDALVMNHQIAQLLRVEDEGITLNKAIKNTLHHDSDPPLKVAYIIWQKPLISVGGDTFIHHMLEETGFVNVFGHMDRYPSITQEELQATDADIVFLSSEPFPFKQKHIIEYQRAFPKKSIHLIDGEMASWYGNRMLLGVQYLTRLRKRLLS